MPSSNGHKKAASPKGQHLSSAKSGRGSKGANRCSVPDESVKLRMTNLDYVWEIDEFHRLRRLCEVSILPVDGVKVRSQSFGSKTSGFWFLELYPGRSAEALRDAEADSAVGSSAVSATDTALGGADGGENCVVFIHLDTSKTTDAMAEFYFFILNEEGKKVDGFKKGAKTFQVFRAEGDPPPCQGCSIPMTEMPRFLRNGKLTIKVEMAVYMGLDFPTFGTELPRAPPVADDASLLLEDDTSFLGADRRGSAYSANSLPLSET
eukprot:Selendium_serpulae@DN10647_c0_g1_i1.p1